MAEPVPANLTDAVHADGFVDFYKLLELPSDATTTALRSRINDLYSDAQANRDHRNINKRREYDTLLELLPQARTILLDESKRQRYDAYAADASQGRGNLDFDQFLAQVTGKSDLDAQERASLLGVQENVAPTPKPRQAPPTSRRPPPSTSMQRRPTTPLGAAAVFVGVFIVVTILIHLKWNIGLAVIIGLIAAALACYFATKPATKPGR